MQDPPPYHSQMQTKSTWLQIRISPDDKARLKAAAERAGQDLSTYVLAKSLPPKLPEFDGLIAWMLASPDSHVPMAECVDYLQTLPAARGAELAAKPARFDELSPLQQNLVCAWVEHRAALWGVHPPAWVMDVPALDRPHYAGGLMNLRPYHLVVSPVVCRRRNIFQERALGGRLARITPPATPDEARALGMAFDVHGRARPGWRVAEMPPRYGADDAGMLARERIPHLLAALDAELALNQLKVDLLMVGGAVMTLVFQAREQTKDIDAIFEPAEPVRAAVARIAAREGLAPDWLNDAVKGFLSPSGRFDPYFEGEALRIFVARADYLLAMKILAMRLEAEYRDADDIRFLCRYLGITGADAALDIVERYYPVQRITPRIRFALDEVLGGE